MIEKGEVRIGVLNAESGSYTYWVHLQCWRVPQKVWLGLPNPELVSDPESFEAALVGMNEVLLCGVAHLPPEKRCAPLQPPLRLGGSRLSPTPSRIV